MKVGSLFSGIGGFDLGLERAGFTIEWQVENNDYCRRVLQKHWPKVPCHYDIKTIDWRYIQPVDLVCGGFPCQPFSLAGKRRGQDDDRYLWPEVVRCLEGIRPTWALLENVAGFASMAQFDVWPPVDSEGAAQGEIGDVLHRVGRGIADEAVGTLEGLGYEVQPFIIPACGVDAPHIRQRIWIVAYTDAGRLSGQGVCQEQPRRAEVIRTGEVREECYVADTSRELSHGSRPCSAGREELANNGRYVSNSASGREQSSGSQCHERGFQNKAVSSVGHQDYWAVEPNVGGSSDGVPDWLDRHIGKGMSYAESQRAIKTLRALWKPDVAAAIWEAAGGLDRISQAEVLFALVREYKKDAHQARLLLASQEALETFVRGVWRATAEASSSRRSKQHEQRSVKHSNAVQMVPQLHSRDTEAPWPALGWEDGILRVASGVENRVDRLRGLGNAIVPQIAEAIGRMILDASQ